MGTRYVTKMRYSSEPEFIRAGLLSFFRTLIEHVSTRYADNAVFDEGSFREAGQQIVRERMAWILGIAVQTKNPGFEEENEYRILTFDDPDRFYPKAIGLVPRVFIKLDPSCVQEVMVGPGADLDLRKSSIEYYRNTHEAYAHVEVTEYGDIEHQPSRRLDRVHSVLLVDRLAAHDGPPFDSRRSLRAGRSLLEEVVEAAGAHHVHFKAVHHRALVDGHLGLRDRAVPGNVAGEPAEEVQDADAALEAGAAHLDELLAGP